MLKSLEYCLISISFSIKIIFIDDFLALSIDFFIPIFSIFPFDFLNPAVSRIFNGIPFKSKFSSIMSLVVPGIDDMIDSSLLDFPRQTINRLHFHACSIHRA